MNPVESTGVTRLMRVAGGSGGWTKNQTGAITGIQKPQIQNMHAAWFQYREVKLLQSNEGASEHRAQASKKFQQLYILSFGPKHHCTINERTNKTSMQHVAIKYKPWSIPVYAFGTFACCGTLWPHILKRAVQKSEKGYETKWPRDKCENEAVFGW